MVMLVYRRISGKMIPMMKDFFRWFKDVDALNVWWKNRDITLWTCLKMWAGAHLGVIFCRDGEKSRFLHVSTYGYRSESMWSYLIYLIYLDLDRDLPSVDAAGVYLISWKNMFYRSVAGSTIRKWFWAHLVWVAMDTAIRPKTDGDSIRSNKMIGTNWKNKVINYDSTQN